MNKVYFGDCRKSMRQMIAEGVTVQTIVTSPPYWNLRDYGVAGQIGQEPTLAEYVATMVEVFDLARELLADDGTLWLNLGDSYASSGGKPTTMQGQQFAGRRRAKESICLSNRVAMGGGVLKEKDLCGVPWRVAFALQEAGWYLRQDIIWHKPNPMPESVRDRCTKAHEYLFLLSKSERYYFDQEAILEPVSLNTHARLSQDVQNQIGSARANGGTRIERPMKAVCRTPGNVNPPKGQAAYEAGDERHRTKAGLLNYARKLAEPGSGTKNNSSFDQAMAIMPDKRNKRSVWTVATEAFSGAHFATFPQALIEPCILAGSRPGDIVLDPFFGSGTTGQVAQRLGRQWIGCELNRDYEPLQIERTRQAGLAL